MQALSVLADKGDLFLGNIEGVYVCAIMRDSRYTQAFPAGSRAKVKDGGLFRKMLFYVKESFGRSHRGAVHQVYESFFKFLRCYDGASFQRPFKIIAFQ